MVKIYLVSYEHLCDSGLTSHGIKAFGLLQHFAICLIIILLNHSKKSLHLALQSRCIWRYSLTAICFLGANCLEKKFDVVKPLEMDTNGIEHTKVFPQKFHSFTIFER